MELYLLRHAEAEDNAASDSARELTPKGQEQARAIGEFCRRQAIRPGLIVTSPYRRTVQTAELVAAALDDCPVEEAPFLSSGMNSHTAFTELRAYQKLDRVMIVGHQPDFGQLAAALLGLMSPENMPVNKASLIGIGVGYLGARGGSLKFFLPVELAANYHDRSHKD